MPVSVDLRASNPIRLRQERVEGLAFGAATQELHPDRMVVRDGDVTIGPRSGWPGPDA
jgi:hypothetical protein